MQIHDVARNIESGWKGKIRRIFDQDGIQMAEMVGIDTLVQNTLFMTDDECLDETDIQWHAIADLVPCKTVQAV